MFNPDDFTFASELPTSNNIKKNKTETTPNKKIIGYYRNVWYRFLHKKKLNLF
ncbi:hypothetical protein ['Camptotheca acuminata' phytoplasma]|uniref:hypothetical protein n=1 Tax='Camptotheca acuminata' phytoplasma TaxID=3239192 RepID=UPI00351A808E